MKEIEDDTHIWKKMIPFSWIGRLNTIKNDHTAQGYL